MFAKFTTHYMYMYVCMCVYTPRQKSCHPRACMGKIDVSIFQSPKGVVPIAPHVTKPKEFHAKNIFEKPLFLKHLKKNLDPEIFAFENLLHFPSKSTASQNDLQVTLLPISR